MPSPKLDAPEITAALFYPRKQRKNPLPPGCHDLEIPAVHGLPALGCRLHVSDRQAPLLIYFHGNAETVADYDELARSYTEAGLNLVVASYRGYGWSGGEPCVSALFVDDVRILDGVRACCADEGFSGPLFLMGRSLGSASAIDLAFRFPDRFKGLIIESGFAETLPLARRLGFDLSGTGLTEEECFNNIGKIRSITMPTLILHGALDQLIPVIEAEKLQAESGARTKQFQVVPGADHNSLIAVAGSLYFDTIRKFIDDSTGANSWRQRRRRFKKGGER